MLKINLGETLNRIRSRSLNENVKKLLGMKGNPSKIALSISLGLFIGLTVPMGLQTIITVPLAILLDCNIILAVLSTSITNPFTIVPIYIAAAKIGELITPFSISWGKTISVFSKPTFQGIASLGKESVILIFTGTLIIGIIASSAAYLIVLKAIISYRKRFPSNSEKN